MHIFFSFFGYWGRKKSNQIMSIIVDIMMDRPTQTYVIDKWRNNLLFVSLSLCISCLDHHDNKFSTVQQSIIPDA